MSSADQTYHENSREILIGDVVAFVEDKFFCSGRYQNSRTMVGRLIEDSLSSAEFEIDEDYVNYLKNVLSLAISFGFESLDYLVPLSNKVSENLFSPENLFGLAIYLSHKIYVNEELKRNNIEHLLSGVPDQVGIPYEVLDQLEIESEDKLFEYIFKDFQDIEKLSVIVCQTLSYFPYEERTFSLVSRIGDEMKVLIGKDVELNVNLIFLRVMGVTHDTFDKALEAYINSYHSISKLDTQGLNPQKVITKRSDLRLESSVRDSLNIESLREFVGIFSKFSTSGLIDIIDSLPKLDYEKYCYLIKKLYR